jgi:thiamine-phosphate pyrophosphorylase
MLSKKKLLRNSRLYVIIDKKVLKDRSLIRTAKKIIRAGAEIIQLRDKSSNKKTILKDALVLKGLLSRSNILFIINDHIDIAILVDSDGVHLGQQDLPIEAARKLLGKDKIIGSSCRNITEALEAQDKGADYIGIGPIFPTSTKPATHAIGVDLIKTCRNKISIPFFAIGGINEENIDRVSSCGGQRVAVCKAICKARNIAAATRKFYNALYKKMRRFNN